MVHPLWGVASGAVSGAMSAAGGLASTARAAAAPRRPPTPAPPTPYTLVGQVRLDANGEGTTSVAPSAVDWIITSRSVSIAGATASGAEAREFLDSVSDPRYLQGTYDGANDSSGRRQLVQPGSVLYCVWTDGPPGAIATFRASGLAYPPGQGAAHL